MFKINHILLKALGIDTYFKTYPLKLLNFIQYFFLTLFLSLVIIALGAHVYLNLNNVDQATEAGFLLCGYISNICTLWALIAVRGKVMTTINEMEQIAKTSNSFNFKRLLKFNDYIF